LALIIVFAREHIEAPYQHLVIVLEGLTLTL